LRRYIRQVRPDFEVLLCSLSLAGQGWGEGETRAIRTPQELRRPWRMNCHTAAHAIPAARSSSLLPGGWLEVLRAERRHLPTEHRLERVPAFRWQEAVPHSIQEDLVDRGDIEAK